MKILIVSDAWEPQVNGVVTTIKNLVYNFEELGYETKIISFNDFVTIPFFYPNVRFPLNIYKFNKLFYEFNPDIIHICTEGPIGIYAKLFCDYKKYKYTTSYHTKFPEYFENYFKIPRKYTYKFMNWFHKKSQNVFVTTESMKNELINYNFKNNLIVTKRGVDKEIFKYSNSNIFDEYKKPILLNVGRISSEKNLEDFFNLNIEGTKICVGDGPKLEEYKQNYKDVIFLDNKTPTELVNIYSSSDVFVFPSKSDTFGLVMIEAMACGLPIAAYPVTGPIDIINENCGSLNWNLNEAVRKCLTMNRNFVILEADEYDWNRVSNLFLDNFTSKE